MQLKVASYNIHKAVGLDGKRDPDRIIAVLRELDADIIALQEVDRRVGERASVLPRAALDHTPWEIVQLARRPRSLGWHGNALLVRRGIAVVDAAPLDLPVIEPRGAVCADLVHEGLRFRVIGAHLDLSGLRRRAQIRAMLAHHHGCAPGCPALVLGDFNQWGVEGGAMRAFGAGWHMLAPGPSFPSRRPLARLDRIVASPEWRLVEAGVHHSALAVRASDHLPVFAELELPSS